MPYFRGDPVATRGMTVGLLGGSFDPPHEGHALISRHALRRLRLDRVWWMVSPGNPLKPKGPAALKRRLDACRAMANHPRIVVTDIEARLGSRYTARTLTLLHARYPGVRFVWLMGADNLAQFHHWDRWRDIARTVPFAVFARPNEQLRAGLSPAAAALRGSRRSAASARTLARARPPAWALLTGPMSSRSSTATRDAGAWP